MNTENAMRFAVEASKAGISYPEIRQLMKDAKRLHRWFEAECNGDVQQDEGSGQWYHHYGRGTNGPFQTVKARDIETPAKARISAIVKAHGLIAAFQGDPRGWPVTLCKTKADADQDRGISVPI